MSHPRPTNLRVGLPPQPVEQHADTRGDLGERSYGNRGESQSNVDPRPKLEKSAFSKSCAQLSGATQHESAVARYRGADELRALLGHDEALGGRPMRLLSARWLLEHFQAAAHAADEDDKFGACCALM